MGTYYPEYALILLKFVPVAAFWQAKNYLKRL